MDETPPAANDARHPPDWADAPPGWDWLAQDADGRWFWYRTEPQLNWSGGVWRSNSRNQRLAGQGAPDPNWDASMRTRPVHGAR